MRLFPLITAVAVAIALYFVVLDRDTLRQLASAPRETPVQQDGAAMDAVSGNKAAPVPAATRDDPVSVVVYRSTASRLDTAVAVRGQTQAVRQVDVRAETSARVISEPLQSGSRVEQDDILCRLDPGTSRAALSEAQARLDEARINYRAAERLSEEGFTSETRRAGMKAALQSAQAAVEEAERRISYLAIRAPFGGVLETDSAELGALLRSGDLCATVIRLDPILLVGFIPETQIDRIEPGAAAQARLATGAEVSGTVTFISRVADPSTRTFRVEITVPNPDLAIRDGQTAEISIGTEGTRAHFLPGSALTLNNDGALGVRVVDEGNVARFRPVQLLRDTPDGVWVGGLPDEVDVIVVGQEYVVDGVRVAPTRRDAPKRQKLPTRQDVTQ